MSVRYIASGDEFRAKQILGEGRHQLGILKNLMSFQNLQQLQRTVRYNDGTGIKVSSFFGQDVINVFVPVGVPVIKEIEIPIEEEIKAMFEFKLTRSDGVEITEESELLEYLRICNSKQVALEVEREYNIKTGYWEVSLVNPEKDIDEKGYWAFYSCKCGVETQYPGKTLEVDRWKDEDLIKANKKYEDIIPSRCFQFKVIRDDGIIITDVMSYFGIVWSSPSFGGMNAWPTYDSDPESSTYQYWLFEIPSSRIDPAGYWVSFGGIEGSMGCQYPWKYKDAEQGKVEDLIQPGKYNAAVPLWDVTSDSDAPDFVLIDDCNPNCEYVITFPSHVHQYRENLSRPIEPWCDKWWTTNLSAKKTKTIKSSVPYKVITSAIHSRDIWGYGYTSEGCYDHPNCPNSLPGPTCFAWPPANISVNGSGGLSESCNPSLGESIEGVGGETYSGPTIGGAAYEVEITVIPGDGEFVTECSEWVGPPDNWVTRKKTLSFPFSRLHTGHRSLYNRISVGARWNY